MIARANCSIIEEFLYFVVVEDGTSFAEPVFSEGTVDAPSSSATEMEYN